MYGILNKKTNKFFAGFENNEPKWTPLKSEAWRDKKIFAETQAALFISIGIKVQRKAVLF